ncbi:MAG: hypothetical protein BWX50_00868 [Euryarchaeota archaeon ADurb.Bin009]|nr:MAG: hypothetical protein BWX50_00868 [Euryarchaeota archaeon ADurb.Bin009]
MCPETKYHHPSMAARKSDARPSVTGYGFAAASSRMRPWTRHAPHTTKRISAMHAAAMVCVRMMAARRRYARYPARTGRVYFSLKRRKRTRAMNIAAKAFGIDAVLMPICWFAVMSRSPASSPTRSSSKRAFPRR